MSRQAAPLILRFTSRASMIVIIIKQRNDSNFHATTLSLIKCGTTILSHYANEHMIKSDDFNCNKQCLLAAGQALVSELVANYAPVRHVPNIMVP